MDLGLFKIKAAVCWYLVHRQTCACSYSTLILAYANYLLTENFTQKKNILFFHREGFFLKRFSFLLLWLLLIFFSLTVSPVVLFAYTFNEPVYGEFSPWRKKNYERLMDYELFFCFVSFILNVIVFVYNGLKQNLILFGKMKS